MSQGVAVAPELGRALRGYRRRAGLSLLRTARAVGIDHSYLSRLEHGRRHPSAATLERLVGVLGVPAGEAEELRGLAGYPARDPLTALGAIEPALVAVARGLRRREVGPETRAAVRAALLGLARLVTAATVLLLALAATGYLDDLVGAAGGLVS